MFGFVRHCTLLALSFVLVGFSEPHPSEARDGCIPGTYLVKEGSGTQSLWTLSVDGTLHITSSAEVAFNFSHLQGAWQQRGRGQAKAVALDFDFISSPIGNGAPPASIARIDISISFSRECNEIEGNLELRFFDPKTEDPLDPATGAGEPAVDGFVGRRVRVK
jgi:hypothetical protein